MGADQLHPDVFVGQMARWWIDRYTGNDPFFLQVGLPGPHPPYDPTQEYLDLYEDKDLPLLPLPIPPDTDCQPKALQELRKFHLNDDADGIVHLENPTPEQSRRQRAHYYAKTRAWLVNEILKWRLESSLKTQGFVEACRQGEQAMMSPPGSPARGQHREDSR